jgi:hypothetical protein
MSFTPQSFDPHVGGIFNLVVGEQTLPLHLAQVEQLGPSIRDGGSFSMLFIGPQEPVLRQAIYTLQRDGLGDIELFIVPVGPQQGGMGYQALFN